MEGSAFSNVPSSSEENQQHLRKMSNTAVILPSPSQYFDLFINKT